MKKTALTMLISSLLLAGTAQAATVYDAEGSKLDVYGRMVGLGYFTEDESSDGDQSYARFGFKGETALNDGWIGFGKLEAQLNSNQSNHWRHIHAGLKSEQFGTVTYGRQFGLFYSQVAAYTDMLMEFGNDGLGDGTDKFGTGRNNGLLTYTYNYSGLTLGAQATLANSAGEGEDYNAVMEKGSEEGYALSAGYDFGNGFGMSAAYNQAQKTNEQISNAAFGGENDAKLAGFGMKYAKDAIYAAVTYSQGNDHLFVNGGFADEHKGLEAVAQYTFDNTLLGLAYIQTDVTNADGIDGTVNNYVSVHGSYSFKPNFFVYGDYKINLLGDEDANAFGKNTDDVFAVGLQYNF